MTLWIITEGSGALARKLKMRNLIIEQFASIPSPYSQYFCIARTKECAIQPSRLMGRFRYGAYPRRALQRLNPAASKIARACISVISG